MRASLHLGLAITTLLGVPARLPAQQAPGHTPPAILQIFREQVKPGKSLAHAASENAWAKAIEASPVRWLAMTGMSGPREVWFMTGFQSFADLQKTNEAMEAMPAMSAADSTYASREGEFLTDTRAIVAAYRKDLSYKPDVDISKMRYMKVITFRVRPGREADFATVAKAYVAAYGKANTDSPWAMYEVHAGMPAPTYLVLLPAKDLAAIDRDMASQAAVGAALGDMAALTKTWSEAAISAETNIFEFSSRMSNMSAEFRAQDPGFWNKR